MSERIPHGAMIPVDERRRLLEERIEQAKDRLVTDIRRASGLVKQATASARQGLLRAALVAGTFVAIGFGALALVSRRRRRLRVTWRWR